MGCVTVECRKLVEQKRACVGVLPIHKPDIWHLLAGVQWFHVSWFLLFLSLLLLIIVTIPSRNASHPVTYMRWAHLIHCIMTVMTLIHLQRCQISEEAAQRSSKELGNLQLRDMHGYAM